MVARTIAIIGAGISGLGAAWALHRDSDIRVYESEERLGGHSNTVDVVGSDGVTQVDTGFIVYNEHTYPNLTRLFSVLGVPTEASDMSFSFGREGGLTYGASAKGILSRPSNLISPRFLRMVRDIIRFRSVGRNSDPEPMETIGQWLQRHGFSEGFSDDYLYPMTGAIWSASRDTIDQYPAASLLAFLRNHGLIGVSDRPQWRTVTGGSRNYVGRLVSGYADRITTGTRVERVERESDRVTVTSGGTRHLFDEVVLACHSDQALQILGPDASAEERRLLGSIRYQPNQVILHSDRALMPRDRRLWSSWNATGQSHGGALASVTYWMNRLQNLTCDQDFFVSVNPLRPPRPGLVHSHFEYAHPVFDRAAIVAQRGLADIQGRNRTWFAGAYLGYGFHEDGLQSGLNVAAALGSPAPWHGAFTPVSSALPVMAGDSA